MNARRWLPLGLLLALGFAAAGIGAAATATSVNTWYTTLHKPAWNPPNWLFGPVWTLLFALMAIATWRVWRVGDPKSARRTIALYSAQLSLNAVWSILFFGLRRPPTALIDVFALLALLVVMLVRYARRDRIAAMLWTPYVLWVTFASALNAEICRLNNF